MKIRKAFRFLSLVLIFTFILITLLTSASSEKAAEVTSTHTGKAVVFEKTMNFGVRSVNAEGEIQDDPLYVDGYVDNEGNNFYYFSGTDILCTYTSRRIYRVYAENPISQDEAIKAAEEYLSEYIEEFSSYSMTSVEYSDQDWVYVIQYHYMVGDIKTDCNIYIAVQQTGDIGAFSMYKRLLTNVADQLIISDEIKEMNKNASIESYISISRSGGVMVEYYEVPDEKGGSTTEYRTHSIENSKLKH